MMLLFCSIDVGTLFVFLSLQEFIILLFVGIFFFRHIIITILKSCSEIKD